MYKLKAGDIVLVVNSQVVPQSFLGSYGEVIDVLDDEALVRFKHFEKENGSLLHTALVSDLKMVGKVIK
jgi:hypothetical protein